jgi:hypothetical protein
MRSMLHHPTMVQVGSLPPGDTPPPFLWHRPDPAARHLCARMRWQQRMHTSACVAGMDA